METHGVMSLFEQLHLEAMELNYYYIILFTENDDGAGVQPVQTHKPSSRKGMSVKSDSSALTQYMILPLHNNIGPTILNYYSIISLIEICTHRLITNRLITLWMYPSLPKLSGTLCDRQNTIE